VEYECCVNCKKKNGKSLEKQRYRYKGTAKMSKSRESSWNIVAVYEQSQPLPPAASERISFFNCNTIIAINLLQKI